MNVLPPILVVFVIFAIAGGIFLLERAQGRKAAAERADEIARFNEYANHLVEEGRNKKAFIRTLSARNWPELRALCEKFHGIPCECSSKTGLAEKLWWHIYRNQDKPYSARHFPTIEDVDRIDKSDSA